VELVGLSEIAEMLGRSTRTVKTYMKRTDFPKPLGHLARGRIWRRRDVERWANRTLPLPVGRPPKRRKRS
jgi:prophage regulatory protein